MERPLRIGIFATHPIQYHAPLFRELASRDGVAIKVFFAHRPSPQEQGIGFGVSFTWDTDLTAGYDHEFLENVAKRPSLISFWGCNTPSIAAKVEGFDLFIIHGWFSLCHWQTIRACRHHRIPIVMRSDSQRPPRGSSLIRRAVKRLIYPVMMRHFTICLAYGQRSADYFRAYGAKRIAISPHFVDNRHFEQETQKQRASRPALRERWNIPDDAFCFLFCGKFEAKKRPMDILRAMTQIQTAEAPKVGEADKEGGETGQTGEQGESISQVSGFQDFRVSVFPRLHLLMVGDGELRKACERYATRHVLPVSFSGFLNQGEIPSAYAAGDCLVLCSDYRETWGLVVNEAMASGLPAICADQVGCVPDLIERTDAGLVYSMGNTQELADRMKQMMNGPNPASQSAREIVSCFTPVAATDRLFAAIECIEPEHRESKS